MKMSITKFFSNEKLLNIFCKYVDKSCLFKLHEVFRHTKLRDIFIDEIKTQYTFDDLCTKWPFLKELSNKSLHHLNIVGSTCLSMFLREWYENQDLDMICACNQTHISDDNTFPLVRVCQTIVEFQKLLGNCIITDDYTSINPDLAVASFTYNGKKIDLIHSRINVRRTVSGYYNTTVMCYYSWCEGKIYHLFPKMTYQKQMICDYSGKE
eukprot:Pgem_evm1s19508